MTDDEKMLLVAKACGWTLIDKRSYDDKCPWCKELKGYFDPLDDCNDMAEIVAKLGLTIEACNTLEQAICTSEDGSITVSLLANGNMPAALRRAVFEVAAQIGETK